jgi:hypothetical protein
MMTDGSLNGREKLFNSKFTPMEQRFLNILADGMPHRPEELFAVLYEQDAPMSNIYHHISTLRAKLRPKGHDIVCENIKRKSYYRHVVLLKPASVE